MWKDIKTTNMAVNNVNQAVALKTPETLKAAFWNHRSVSLAEMLTKAMEEWGLMSKDPAIVTDNAANMVCAVEITGLTHGGCFAHIINRPRKPVSNCRMLHAFLGE
ncbi:hypothetical protein DPEC_G00036760 [Dallia pectoralis]|uniref:Uncharacterized protein n=1 Tax=Dallia pectoralis TaxID=75939 RepID=A0ACC2HDW4_DALPE|nr:hypothetical protein DPEC_G00036760 [Dallia pectoralis]